MHVDLSLRLIISPQIVVGDPPEDIVGMPVNSQTVLLSWHAPPVMNRASNVVPVTYYKIRYQKVNEKKPDGEPTKELQVNPDETSVEISGLDKWTPYRFWIMAGTAVGDGPPSKEILVTTDEDGRPRGS